MSENSHNLIVEDERLWVTFSEKIDNGGYMELDVSYAGEQISVVLFRYKGKCYAYRNLCRHMPRKLNCESKVIFDLTGQYLRCSMHGVVYEPTSGESVGTMCSGERLTPIELIEDDDGIWITDRRVTPLTVV